MYDVFIFHGHGEGDNGASGNDYLELVLARQLTNRVVEILTSKGLKVHTNKGLNNYHRNLTKGEQYKYRFGYTLHLNSGGGSGSEIISPKNENGLDLDFAILDKLEKLGLRNRGVKSRDYDNEMFIQRVKNDRLSGKDYYKEIREAWSHGTSLGILEVCFIDNARDVDIFINNIDRVASLISDEVLKVCGRPQSNASTDTLKLGERVKVKTLLDYKNVTNASWVLNETFDIQAIQGNRVVIGRNGQVTGAWHRDNLRRV